jgi:hypothetical protein
MEPKDKPGVVNGSFVPKEFYLQPPEKGASPEAWASWLEADAKLASQAKRKHTKSLAHEEVPDFLQPKVLSKVGGVYRQSAMVGFIGDGDTARVEAAVDADQDRRAHLTPWDKVGGRGSEGSQRLSGAQRRKAKRQARKARLRMVKH